MIATKILDVHTKRRIDQSMLNILLKEKSNTERSINNLISAIEKGVLTGSTKRRLDELEILQVDIENKILIEQSKLKIQTSKDDIIDYIKNGLKEEPKAMLDLLIEKIILYNDKIEIIYNFTEKKNPDDDNQDFLFYSGTTLLPTIIQNKPAPVMKEIQLNITFHI